MLLLHVAVLYTLTHYAVATLLLLLLLLLFVQVLVDHKLQSAALRRQIDQIGREREALEAKRDDITRAVNDVSYYTFCCSHCVSIIMLKYVMCCYMFMVSWLKPACRLSGMTVLQSSVLTP
jgi:hypothetical protein